MICVHFIAIIWFDTKCERLLIFRSFKALRLGFLIVFADKISWTRTGWLDGTKAHFLANIP
jgi:hypothetical protein